MSVGKFIVVDGIDGSGKTWLLERLQRDLSSANKQVKVFRAIGEGHHGQKLRELMLGSSTRMNPLSEAMIFLSAINESYLGYVLPWVEAGNIALMDRFIYSTLTYQQIAYELWPGKKDAKAFNKIKELARILPVPGMSIILSVNKSTAIQNIQSRSAVDILDNFCLSNLDQFIHLYRDLKTEPIFSTHNFVYIENSRPYNKPINLEPVLAFCNS